LNAARSMKLELSGVWKSFGSQPILRGINLDVDQTRTLALIGPSGGGKSTLLRLLAGLDRADAGRIVLDGQVLPRTESGLRRHRMSIGTVFQAYNLFPHLNALRNITLPLEKVHGLEASRARATAEQILERLQLWEHRLKMPAELSGGQRQRVAIARAIAIRPRLLLFDEPTSALDPEMTAEVLEVIEELRHEGRDFILVTHQMGFARKVADKVALLSGGRIVECGPPAAVLEHPQSDAARQFLSRILKY
jgi:polar amino acid transport system ATP-binding protein